MPPEDTTSFDDDIERMERVLDDTESGDGGGAPAGDREHADAEPDSGCGCGGHHH
jgi:hypothetical protein